MFSQSNQTLPDDSKWVYAVYHAPGPIVAASGAKLFVARMLNAICLRYTSLFSDGRSDNDIFTYYYYLLSLFAD